MPDSARLAEVEVHAGDEQSGGRALEAETETLIDIARMLQADGLGANIAGKSLRLLSRVVVLDHGDAGALGARLLILRVVQLSFLAVLEDPGCRDMGSIHSDLHHAFPTQILVVPKQAVELWALITTFGASY